MLRRHIGQQIDVHLPLPQARYTLVGIKSLLKIGEAGVLAARGGVPEPLKPSLATPMSYIKRYGGTLLYRHLLNTDL